MNAKLLELLKKYWFVPVLVAGGIVAGWYIKPSKVETVEIIKNVEVVQKDTRIDELLTQFEQLNRDYQEMKDSRTNEKYHREVLESRLPDGTVTVHTTEDHNIESVVQETRKETEVKVVEVERQVVVKEVETVTKTEYVEKIVRPELAQWKVGVLGGVNPTLVPTPGVNSWIVGGEVERRIAGPFWGGIWGAGTTTGQAMGGLKVSIEF